jgi:aryl-alcohol dehydrogenase-like predicted oxidoreductase
MDLEHVSLGRTGTQVSNAALGTWRFGYKTDDDDEVEIGHDRALALLDANAAAGGTFIDTADTYGDGRAEEWIGDWLVERDRESFVIASKVYWSTREGNPNFQGLGRKHLRRQIDHILDRLGTDYLDLLYITRWWDETPADEFMRTLDGFVRDGRVHYLGISCIMPNAWKVVKANELAKRKGYEPFTVTQPRYTLVNRAAEHTYLDMCRDYELGVCPWSPLAGGFLTGKYRRDEEPPDGTRAAREPEVDRAYLTAENFDVLDVVREVAGEVDATPAQVSLAWLMHHDAITAPIIGAHTVEQLEGNLDATTVELTDEQFERLANAA